MSVIAAIVPLGGQPVDAEALGRMCDAASDAGPDGRGVWAGEQAGLAHRLLISTPESRHEHQPLHLGSDVWISADARIDNREELSGLLRSAGVDFDAIHATDDEYILRAYGAWGAECLPRLLGDFAFVIWDGPRRRLFCARDCFGARPLYYFADQRRFLIASTIRQILADPDVPRALDEDVVEDWLVYGRRQRRDATFYQAVRQVPPGHSLLVDERATVRVTEYWRWRQPRTIRYSSADEYAEHLRWVFGESVRARLRAVGPVGLMLSGGLDSGSIAGMAASVLRLSGRGAKTLRGYSFAYDATPSCDERSFIEPLVAALGIDSTYLYPERCKPFAGASAADEPNGSDAYDPSWTAALRDLKERGGRVMLTGYGGETLLLSQSPYHFIDWFLSGQWRQLWRELSAYRRSRGRWPALDWRGLATRLLPEPLYVRLPLRRGTHLEPPWLAVSPASRQRRARRRRAARGPWRMRSFAKQAALDALIGSDSAASIWAGLAQTAQGAGVEHAHPFMDRRLHEYVYALPLWVFFDRGWDRAVMRAAMRGLVPDCVRLRGAQTLFDDFYAARSNDAQLWKLAQAWADQLARRWLPPVRLASPPAPAELRRYCGELIWLLLFLHWSRNVQ